MHWVNLMWSYDWLLTGEILSCLTILTLVFFACTDLSFASSHCRSILHLFYIVCVDTASCQQWWHTNGLQSRFDGLNPLFTSSRMHLFWLILMWLKSGGLRLALSRSHLNMTKHLSCPKKNIPDFFQFGVFVPLLKNCVSPMLTSNYFELIDELFPVAFGTCQLSCSLLCWPLALFFNVA